METEIKKKKKGTEFFIGAIRDPLFGPLITFGLGGIYVEVFHDVAFRLAPLSNDDINYMITTIKSNKLLDGVRGNPPLDKNSIKNTIAKIAELMLNHQDISELDINPLLAFPTGCLALDSRIIIKK